MSTESVFISLVYIRLMTTLSLNRVTLLPVETRSWRERVQRQEERQKVESELKNALS